MGYIKISEMEWPQGTNSSIEALVRAAIAARVDMRAPKNVSTEMAKPDLVTEIASFPNSPAKDTPNSPAKDTSADKPAADGAAPAPAPDPPPPPPPAAE